MAKKIKLTDLIPLEKNPFRAKDPELTKLKKSIKDFEKMLSIRKIIVDEKNTIMGGNKRFFALKKLGYIEIPESWIDKRTDLTEHEKKQFIVKDNIGFGEWDQDILNEGWDSAELADWGLELNEFQEEENYNENIKNNNSEKINLNIELSENDLNLWKKIKSIKGIMSDSNMFKEIIKDYDSKL